MRKASKRKAGLATIGAVSLAFSTLFVGQLGAMAADPATTPTTGGRNISEAIPADAIAGTGVYNLRSWGDITKQLNGTGEDKGVGGARVTGYAVLLDNSATATEGGGNTAVPEGTKIYMRWTDRDGQVSPIYVTQTHNGFKGAKDGAYAFSIPKWIDSRYQTHYFRPGVHNQPRVQVWFEPYTDETTNQLVVPIRNSLSGLGNPGLLSSSFYDNNEIGAHYLDLQYINDAVLWGYQMPADYMKVEAKQSTSEFATVLSEEMKGQVQGEVWIESKGSTASTGPNKSGHDPAAAGFTVYMSALSSTCQKDAEKIGRDVAAMKALIEKNPGCVAETVKDVTDSKGRYSLQFSSQEIFNHGNTFYGWVEDSSGKVLPAYSAFADNVFNNPNQNLGRVEPHPNPAPKLPTARYMYNVNFAVVPYYALNLTLDKNEVKDKTTPVTPVISGYSFSPAGNTIVWTDKSGNQVGAPCTGIKTNGAIDSCSLTAQSGAVNGDSYTATLYYGETPVASDSFVYTVGDEDDDKVPDDKDKCPGTPAADKDKVDEDGCTMAQRYVPNYTDTNAKVGEEAISEPPTFDDTTTKNVEKLPFNTLGKTADGKATFAPEEGTAAENGAITYTPEKEGDNLVEVTVTYPDGTTNKTNANFKATDGDGDDDNVPDSKDKCPNTPAEYKDKVDAFGCVIPEGHFDIKGTAKEPISEKVHVTNPDHQEITGCTATGLPEKLTVQWDGTNCVISGTVETAIPTPQDAVVTFTYNNKGDGSEETFEAPGTVSINAEPDDDHDGVPNSTDKCPNTPAGAKVDDNGCSKAPVLDNVPNVNGEKDKEITQIDVPIVNEGNATIVSCESPELEKLGLKITYDSANSKCVISGTPKETVDGGDYKVIVKYTPGDDNNPNNGTAEGTGKVTVIDGDDDGDEVPNSTDKCPNTPAGAKVDDNGCSKAPTVPTVPDVKGEKDKEITPVVVPIDNPGKTDVLKCEAEGLAEGLEIKMNEGGTACIISGKPTEVKTGDITVTVTFEPKDNKGNPGTTTGSGKVDITTPGGNTPGGNTPGGGGGTIIINPNPAPVTPPVAGVKEKPNPIIRYEIPQNPPVAGVNEQAPSPAIVSTTPQLPQKLARTGVNGIPGFAGAAIVLLLGGVWFTMRGRKADEA